MDRRHSIEIAAELGSAALLAFAAGFFARVALTGSDELLALAVSLVAALLAGAGAWAALRLTPASGWRNAPFDMAEIDAVTEDDALLLTDPLEALPDDSRVVRLFALETLHVPGELAERIDDWLDGARSRQRAVGDGGRGHGPDDSPASAALHAALADIRRTLR